jgi:glutathione peroxidase-family protein
MNFNEYLSKHTCLYSETKSFSASLLSYLECAYEKHGIKVATFFNMNNDNSENDIYNKVNNLIRQQYKIKFHNISKIL